MTDGISSAEEGQLSGRRRVLAILRAIAMFVLVVDTSLMNPRTATISRTKPN